jgi:hypothetical protein
MRRLPAPLAALLLAWGMATGTGARADAAAEIAPELEHLVILLRPPAVDELTQEALSRINGELSAARFRVIIFPLDPASDPVEQVETVGRDLDPVAAFALMRGIGPSAESVELWISDRLAQRTTIQRMRVRAADPSGGGDVSRAAAVLAVESVELIRVSMADLWPRPAPRATVVPGPPTDEPPPRTAALGLGVSMLHDFGDLGPTFAPVARIAFGRPGGFGVSIVARALGPEVDVTQSAGSAHVRRATGWVAVGRSFRPRRALQPLVSLGVGADYLRAAGAAADPALAHTRASWSALAVAGAGLAAQVAPHVDLMLDVEGMVFVPPVVVRIAGEDAARFDRPSVLVNAGLQAEF